jgi:hypothetical protein
MFAATAIRHKESPKTGNFCFYGVISMPQKTQPGNLNPDQACPTCGEPTSTDAQGRITCFQCGGFIEGTVPMEQIKKVRKPRNLALVVKSEWGERAQ